MKRQCQGKGGHGKFKWERCCQFKQEWKQGDGENVNRSDTYFGDRIGFTEGKP